MASKGKNKAGAKSGGKTGPNPQKAKASRLTAAVYTLILIAAAIGIIMISSILIPDIGRAARGGDMMGRFEPPAPEMEIAFLEDNMALRFGISALNVILVVYLLYIYIKDYLALKTNFTLGIVAVLFSFLLYALTSFPLVRLSLGPLGIAGELSFVPMFFSAIGLLIFAKLGNE